MTRINLDPKNTALIFIDLQHGIVARQCAPHATGDVVKRSATLATHYRAKGAAIVYVRVDLNDILKMQTDKSMRDPNAPPPPLQASELVPEAGMQPGDILITKRQWGAFYGTDLEQQLRRQNIQTILLGGIATNFGVESTARSIAGLGFDLIVIEDACTTFDAEMHHFSFEKIFPFISRVCSTEQALSFL